jgi:hypothetical protein
VASVGRIREIFSDSRQRNAVDLGSLVVQKDRTQLLPAARLTHIDERTDATAAKHEHRLGRLRREVGQQCNGRNSWELADGKGNAWQVVCVATIDGDDDRRRTIIAKVPQDVVHRVAMPRAINAIACRIDPQALIRCEHGGDAGNR